MSERRDRLDSMVPREGVADSQATRALLRGPAGRRVLLYAPPPALAKHYLALLEGEGWEVMLATEPAAADLLLTSWPPQLVVAVVPVLPADLRERWRALAPEADVRWASGLSDLIDLQVLPPRELLGFTVRALAAIATAAVPPGGVDVVQVLRLATAAAEELSFGDRDVATVQLEAVLLRAPELLAGEGRDGGEDLEATERSERRADRRLLAELGAATGCPLPLGLDRTADGSGPALPLPGEVVEAAARLVQLVAQGERSPEVALRRLAREGGRVPGMLHPAAVEAVLVAHGERQQGSRGRVLLVDPDAGARNLLALRLRNEGYDVRALGDGRAALDELRRDPPALVLAEAVLPRLDGFALLDALVRDGRTDLPFVFLSSRNDAMSVNKGLLLGAADYLGKPVNVEVLLTKVQRLIASAGDDGEPSARYSLSDFALAGSDEMPIVSYEQLAPGAAILGRFRLVKALGEGGMGKVFRARDERLDEDVVVKVMKPQLSHDPAVLERFKREIRLARRITHPQVVRIFDFWEAGPLKFLTMEYLEGSNLRVELQRRGAFPPPVALRVGEELLQALAAAHAVGVVHRDVKPHNVLMLPSGHVKVLDFGIAQALEAPDGEARGGVAAGVVAGTFEYMSPEQVAGEPLDARSDLYSAGLVLYELLAGEAAFRGTDRLAVAQLRLTRDPRPLSAVNPRVPPEVDAFVLRLLSRDREGRPASARAAVEELAKLRG
jgi:DNA-binding response OmpR family regulator/tRNA A-37 threonylcarbamoyl transferase component Bud32